MDIIQSYWSKPFFDSSLQRKSGRYQGGWKNIKYHYLSWALSCLTFKKYYGEIDLITDTIGYETLVKELRLPYSNVSVALNDCNKFPSEMWAASKIYTYHIINKPFIHVDGDVFIWSKLDFNNKQPSLIAQSETNFHLHRNFQDFQDTLLKMKDVPESILEYWQKDNTLISSVNAGIIGGNDLNFFKKYTTQSLDFIENNLSVVNSVSPHLANMICEEHLFFCLANQENIPIEYLIKNVDINFSRVTRFNLLPFEENYIHTVGSAKKSDLVCNQVEWRMRYHFPEYYQRIINYVEGNYDMKLDKSESESILFSRTNKLIGYFSRTSKKEINYDTSISEIENLGMKDVQTEIVNSLFKIEKQAYEFYLDTIIDEPFAETEKIYDFLATAVSNDILSTKLVLSPNIRIIELEYYLSREKLEIFSTIDDLEAAADHTILLIYKDFQTNTIRELPLQGKSMFLYDFKQPTTGKNLFNAIISKYETAGRAYDSNKIIGSLIQFLTWHLVMTRFLTISLIDKD